MSAYAEIKERVYQSNIDLVRYGLVLFTFGNASAIDRQKGIVAIKPSGVRYDVLKPADIVVLDLEGAVVEGALTPSSDTPTHLVLYQQFPEIGGVAHTHSTYAVAWAQAGQPIPILGTTHADHLPQPVPCTKFMSGDMVQKNYETATGHQIIEAFKGLSYQEIEMVLVAGHGPFTWGKTIETAIYNSVMLEELAKMALLTRQINSEAQCLSDALVQKHYQRKHGENAYYGQIKKF